MKLGDTGTTSRVVHQEQPASVVAEGPSDGHALELGPV